MPIPLQLRATNLAGRLDILEDRIRHARENDPAYLPALERDWRVTLAELRSIRGALARQESLDAQRDEIAAREPPNHPHRRIGYRTSRPPEEPATLGRRVGG